MYIYIIKFRLESRLYQAFPDTMLIASVFPHFYGGKPPPKLMKVFFNTPRITNEICIVVYRTVISFMA